MGSSFFASQALDSRHQDEPFKTLHTCLSARFSMVKKDENFLQPFVIKSRGRQAVGK